MSRIAVSNRLAEVGELVETEALSTMRQKLKKMERTRHLAVWHDHSSVANHRYFLFLVGVMYDPAIHLTDKEFKENCGKEVEVQKIIEKPELYIVARYLYMYNPMVLNPHSIDKFQIPKFSNYTLIHCTCVGNCDKKTAKIWNEYVVHCIYNGKYTKEPT